MADIDNFIPGRPTNILKMDECAQSVKRIEQNFDLHTCNIPAKIPHKKSYYNTRKVCMYV